jgi:hypothetical protein
MCGEWVFEAMVVSGVEENGRARQATRGDLQGE